MAIKTAIQSSALTSDAALKCFAGRISADRFRGDVAMESAAMALFDKRLAPDEKIKISFQSFYSGDMIENVSSYMNDFRHSPSGTLMICSISTQKDDAGKQIAKIMDKVDISGLYPMQDIMKVLKSQDINALFLTDTQPDAKNPLSPFDNTKSFVVMENMTMTRWHMLCSLLKRLLGKWFAEKPMTPDEMAGFAKSLQAETPDAFLDAVQKYADSLDLRGMFIRDALKDFESRFEKERIKALEKECKTLDIKIADYDRMMLDAITKKDELLATLFGYQTRETPAEPVTMNYFLANKNLFLVNCTASQLDFYDCGWLDQFDAEKAKATFAKDHMSSWLEYNNSFDVPDEDAKLLFKSIFVKENIKIRLWSHFQLFLRSNGSDSTLNVINGHVPHPDIHNALPNPHHCYNTCPGNNRRLVDECMRRRDIVGAIAQCINATKGVNIMEHASYHFLARDIFDPKFGKVIYINELDEFMTTKDAIKYLKDHETKKA